MRLKYFLGLSLALNAVALGWFLFSTKYSPPLRPDGASTSDTAQRLESSRSAPPRESSAKKLRPVPGADWLQALRHAAVPDDTIADLAVADFENRWQKRMRDNQREFERGDIDEDTLTRLQQEHDPEQEEELRAVLGDEGFRRWDQARMLADFDQAGLELTANEADEIYSLRKEFERKRRELTQARPTEKADAENSRLPEGELYTHYSQQLMKLLGEDRYAVLRSGNPGLGDLRRNLRAMNVDDRRFADMEKVQQTWNTRRGKLDLLAEKGQLPTDEYEKQLQALAAERDREYQKLLGAETFAVFQRNQDERYRTLKRLGPACGFSDGDLENLYTALQAYEHDVRDYRERAQAIEAQGQPVDWPAIENSLKEFSRQTEATLRASLGEKFDKLKQNNVMPFDDSRDSP